MSSVKYSFSVPVPLGTLKLLSISFGNNFKLIPSKAQVFITLIWQSPAESSVPPGFTLAHIID